MSFTEIERRDLPEMRTVGRIFKHDCGMLVLSLENNDTDNMFSVGFSTTPQDHTGVPHILEHSVLAGSKKYPVKEPFMEMIKGSLATFINAVTYQDHTLYPVSSTVKADYFNLASVYFDAVFNPLLSKNIFQQEGWHLEFEKPGDIKSKLKVNGIVYNEMRGAMADLDTIIMKESYGRLLSKSPRRFISGGLPEAIPHLTYEGYKKYYRNHYHPSVARVFLYGNIPTEEKLAFLDKCLAELDSSWLSLKVDPEPPRPIQPKWDKPKKATVHFMPALDAEEDECAWAMAFLLENHWDTLLDMSFDFLEYLLLGNAASPLKKAILESKLCASLAISGFDDETPETNFILAVTGIKPANFSKMEKLVENTLRHIAETSFTQQQINAAFAQFKLQQQHIGKDYVYNQMEKVFDVWCYGEDPFMLLDCRPALQQLQEKLENDKNYLPSLIRKYLIENPHRLTLHLLPDSKLTEKADAKAAAKMAIVKAKKTQKQLLALDKAACELKATQGAPNTAEALQTLPRLNLAQVPKTPILAQYDKTILNNGIAFCSSNIFTNGIAYMEIVWPLDKFTPEQLLDLSLFTHYMQKMGLKGTPYDEVAAQWASLGATISADIFTGTSPDVQGLPVSKGTLHISMMGLEESLPKMLALLQRQITEADFSDNTRFDFLANELRVKDRETLAYYGRTYTGLRSAAGLSNLASFAEMTTGLTAVERNKKIAASIPVRRKLAKSFHDIANCLASLAPVLVTFTGSNTARKKVQSFAEKMPGPGPINSIMDAVRFQVPDTAFAASRVESYQISAEVSACTRCYRAPFYWNENNVPLSVFANILSCGYLWNEIRIKGGAYGTAAKYSMMLGIFNMMSAQDPSPERSFKIMDQVPLQLASIISNAELDKAIISSIRGFHSPIRPSSMSGIIRNHELCGIDNEMLTQRHEQFLSLNKQQLCNAVEAFWANSGEHNDCVIGPAKALKSFPKIKW